VTYRPNNLTNGRIKGSSSGRVKTATSLNNYLISTNLSNPTTYPWGNVSRNSVRSDAFYQTDLGLHKAFPLWNDSSNFDFRAEAFNVLNNVNYLPSANGNFSNFGNSSFGQITGAFPARQLQLAAKIIF
jgi:hypothetical protein